MHWAIIAAAGFAAISPADAGTDYPHRDWGQVAMLDMTVAEATACIARELDRNGSVLILPTEGGNDIDYTMDVLWGKKPDAWERFKIRPNGDKASLKVFYRHPVSQKETGKDVARLQKKCLVVATITPSQ